MKARYYPEDDLLVLKVSERPYDYAEKIGLFVIHYTKKNEPVMLEILHASQFLKETTEALPHRVVAKILKS
jgi:hypothetical protein